MGGLAHWDNSPLVAGTGGKADGQLNMAVGLWRRAQTKGQVGLGEGLGMEKGLKPVVHVAVFCPGHHAGGAAIQAATGWGRRPGGK